MSLFSRSLPIATSMAILVSIPVLADDDAAANKNTVNRTTNDRVAAIRKALAQPIALSFAEAPLSEVVRNLREKTKVDVMLDDRSLDLVGIGGDTPISFKLEGVCLRSALRLLLRDFELTWIIHNESILITLPEVAEENLATRFYPIGDLVRGEDPSRLILPQFGGGGFGGGGFGGGEAPEGAAAEAARHIFLLEDPADDDDRLAYDTLVELITSTVAPNTWDDVGGPGSISRFRNLMSVNQTEEVHEAVRSLLDALLQFKKQAAAGDAGKRLVIDLPPKECADGLKQLLAALDRKTSLNLREAPLGKTIESIAADHKVPILLDNKALDVVGIGGDQPISVEANDLPLKVALTRMLSPLELTWMIYENVLLITIREVAEENQQTRLLQVTDLLKTNGGDLAQVTNELKQLAETIQAGVAADTWDHVGGPGIIVPLAELEALVVSQTSENHQQIERLLAELQRKMATPEVAGAAGAAPAEKLHLVVYQLKADDEGKPLVSPEDLVEVVRDLIEPKSWHDRDVYLRGVGQTLVVRQKADVHRRIVKLLEALQAIEPQQQEAAGNPGGFF